MKFKFNEWLKRYFPAEIFAFTGAIIGGLLTNFAFRNPILTAIGGTWGENIAYYGKIIFSDIKEIRLIDKKITFINLIKVIRNIFIEFGPGEIIDSFIIRPTSMYFFCNLMKNITFGIFLGKITADLIFYSITISSYEFKKKYFTD